MLKLLLYLFTKLIVVIISKYIHISNHHFVHLKLIQCLCQLCLNKTGKKFTEGQEKIAELSYLKASHRKMSIFIFYIFHRHRKHVLLVTLFQPQCHVSIQEDICHFVCHVGQQVPWYLISTEQTF